MKIIALGITMRRDSGPAVFGLSMSLRHSTDTSGIFWPKGIDDCRISCCRRRRTASQNLPADNPSVSSLPSARRFLTSKNGLIIFGRNWLGTFAKASSSGALFFDVFELAFGIGRSGQFVIPD